MILQQSDQEAADCNHASEREREYNVGGGKDNTKFFLQICIYMFCVIIHQQLDPDFVFFFLFCSFCVRKLQRNQNYKSFEKYKTFKGSPT